MNKSYEFFIAGRTRNKDAILRICDIFDRHNISYYCFLKNDETMNSYGSESNSVEENMEEFESLGLKLLVLPAGKSGHIEAGIAYGMGKKCYAIGEYEATDSLYNIFDRIFANEEELDLFLSDNY